MANVLLFHPVLGQTPDMEALADVLRAVGSAWPCRARTVAFPPVHPLEPLGRPAFLPPVLEDLGEQSRHVEHHAAAVHDVLADVHIAVKFLEELEHLLGVVKAKIRVKSSGPCAVRVVLLHDPRQHHGQAEHFSWAILGHEVPEFTAHVGISGFVVRPRIHNQSVIFAVCGAEARARTNPWPGSHGAHASSLSPDVSFAS